VVAPGKRHHVVAIIDALAEVVSFVVDAVVCDGGDSRATGWMRYAEAVGDVSGTGVLRVAPSMRGKIHRCRVYGRYLRTSEAIARYHAGP
jgi:hypothetical protein